MCPRCLNGSNGHDGHVRMSRICVRMFLLHAHINAATAHSMPPGCTLHHVRHPLALRPRRILTHSFTGLYRIMPTAPVVLAIGYHWNHPRIIQAHFDPHTIRLHVTQGPEIMARFGYEMDGFFVEPLEDSDNKAVVVASKRRGGTSRASMERYGDGDGGATLSTSPYDAATDDRRVDATSEQYVVSNIERYIAKLKSREYEAVLIGFLIRLGTDRAETVLLERIVNATREFAPRTKMAFNWSPGSTLDALKRVVPVLN